MARRGVTLFPHGLGYGEAADLGRLAEDSGFDAVFVVEAPNNNDALAMAQAIAARTRRITVGTGIANVYLRHPALLGAAAVAIDELSGGRFVLGLGVNNEAMVRAYGLAWEDPRTALRRTTEWVQRVFGGETMPPFRHPFRAATHAIPIHLGGVALESADLAGEIADGLMLYLATPDRVQVSRQRMREAAERAGRKPDALTVTVLIPAFVDETLQTARRAAREFLAFYATVPLYTRLVERSGFEAEAARLREAATKRDAVAARAAVSDRLMDAICLVGSPARCHERLAEIHERGVDYPLIAPQPVDGNVAGTARRVIEALAPR
jgi:alkanesulfonate monooxygenase SsuD/methylene tetrahydromethanopterin reductase-like flavin-dependent oxidoreductase (luciferase family)